jgi:hypothetical protein
LIGLAQVPVSIDITNDVAAIEYVASFASPVASSPTHPPSSSGTIVTMLITTVDVATNIDLSVFTSTCGPYMTTMVQVGLINTAHWIGSN